MYYEVLTGGDMTKVKAVEQMDCNTALVKLMLEKDKKAYEKDLQRVYERKAKKK